VELTKKGLIGTLVVLVVVVVCVRLGFWQLDRREQRLERNAAVAERRGAEPVRLWAVPEDTAGLGHRPAEAEGVWDHDRTVVLAGRSLGGTPGVHILTPLRLGDGAILVNRGWFPSADAATVDLSLISRPEQGRVAGLLTPFPDVPSGVAPAEFRTRWVRFDGDGIRGQYPYPVARLYLLDTGGEAAGPVPGPPGPGGYTAGQRVDPTAAEDATGPPFDPVRLDPPALDNGPHLSYAVQWFSFATIFLVGWLVLLVRRPAGGVRAPVLAGGGGGGDGGDVPRQGG
jgi:surfeit locus 1 family protein